MTHPIPNSLVAIMCYMAVQPPSLMAFLNKDHIATVITFQFGEDEKQIAIY